ncbi:MAG: GntR family transcriptional regulator [Fimbriimonadaceae bacterium]|nr:GntR family transcriptional regulator [Fimbriimonadaceae bacterium]
MFEPVKRTIQQQVKERLLEEILAGKHRPGDRLRELEIARQFGVSQAPVREALRQLAELRIVESHAHRGTWVREFSYIDSAHIYQVRAALEELALVTPRTGRDPSLEKLRRFANESQESAHSSDIASYIFSSHQFHREIVESSANDALAEIWHSLLVPLRMQAVIAVLGTGGRETWAREHLDVVELLEQGNRVAAAAQLRRHLEGTAHALIAKASSEKETGPDRSIQAGMPPLSPN